MRLDDRRLEELCLNSSTPPGQLLYDGWLLRMLPGKAKRARSVNAVYSSTLPLDAKIAHCERLYATVGVPLIFRITPFSQPPDLDRELDTHGFVRFEETSVQYAPIDSMHFQLATANVLDLPAWLDAVAMLRGSPAQHRDAHRARLEGSPLKLCAVAAEEHGRIVATGLTIVEGDCAGLFDIVTGEDVRRKGYGRSVVASLMRAAWDLGARHAYLQVGSGNEGARRLYTQFGFQERYTYWYRGRTAEQPA